MRSGATDIEAQLQVGAGCASEIQALATIETYVEVKAMSWGRICILDDDNWTLYRFVFNALDALCDLKPVKQLCQ